VIGIGGAGGWNVRGIEVRLAVAAGEAETQHAIEGHVNAGDHAADRVVGSRHIAVARERAPAAEPLRPDGIDGAQRGHDGGRLLGRQRGRRGGRVSNIGEDAVGRRRSVAHRKILPQPVEHGVAQEMRLLGQHAGGARVDRSVAEARKGGARVGRRSADYLLPGEARSRRVQRIGDRRLVRRRSEVREALGAARGRQVAVEAILAEGASTPVPVSTSKRDAAPSSRGHREPLVCHCGTAVLHY
jgi:hypothetical protein